MKKKFLNRFTRNPITLKKRIVFSVITGMVITFICVGLISYYTISSVLNNKISNNIGVSTQQIRLSLENTMDNLNYASQLLSSQGIVGNNISMLLVEDNLYEKSRLLEDIREQLSFLGFSNPNIGFHTYYFADTDTYMFQRLNLKKGSSILDLPLILEYYKISYYGPHESVSQASNQYVMSAIRKVDFPDRDDVFVYLESGFNLTKNLLESSQLMQNTHIVILDNNYNVVYSETPEQFPIRSAFDQGTIRSESENKIVSGINDNYYWFLSKSQQGWSVVSVISKSDFSKENNEWIANMSLAFIGALLLSILLGVSLWRFIYGPLRKFEEEIELVADNKLDSTVMLTKVSEFNSVLLRFQNMKQQIKHLIHQVSIKEKSRADLEIEKLRSQINPHFLMNTLNTVHWMAMMNNQLEIDTIVISLNKLLMYNLDKNNEQATLKKELKALEDYLTIQKMRYNFSFQITCNTPEIIKQTPVPRFILQPLAENALFHGIKDDGVITITVQMGKKLVICIKDDGVGMSEERKQDILSNEWVTRDKVGMGIGINYVLRILESQYGTNADFEIESTLNVGTSIYIGIPISLEGDKDV